MKKIFSIIAVLLFAVNVFAQNPGQSINVGIMLPLHTVNGDGKRMLEYYRGMLMAVEKLKHDGQNINIYTWNTAEDIDIRSILIDPNAKTCNIIFGPLYTKQVKLLSDFCRSYNIKMVIPFSIYGNEVDTNPLIYQVYQSSNDINQTVIQQVPNYFNNSHVVFIDCNDSTSNKGTFTQGMRQALEQQGRQYNITNLNVADDVFVKSFSLSQPNLVILNSGRSPELTAALNKLDRLVAINQSVQISVLGYTEWLLYTDMNKERFAKYNAYIPTHFYYNKSSNATMEFEQKYRWRFHQDMMYALPHFALTGYDHAMFFLSNNGNPYWLQTPLKFYQQGTGGYRNKAFMLIHYKADGSIEAINY